MASQREIEEVYNWVNRFHEMYLGECADWSCAFFNGDFSKTLEDAQSDKHTWILDGINCNRSSVNVLDVGSGWGPVLRAVREKGGNGIGLTLSSAQVNYCERKRLNAQLLDWRKAKPRELGEFDGVVSVGAFEHFCSIEEYKAGKQMDIYKAFFDFCANVLPEKRKLYLQTMTWGKKVPDPNEISLEAPNGSDELILARTIKFFPGSWLPDRKEQIVDAASDRFDYISSNNGRLDYIETLKRWGEASRSLLKPSKLLKTLGHVVALVPRYLTDPNFRVQIQFIKYGDQSSCFAREIMSHERMFFEKR